MTTRGADAGSWAPAASSTTGRLLDWSPPDVAIVFTSKFCVDPEAAPAGNVTDPVKSSTWVPTVAVPLPGEYFTVTGEVRASPLEVVRVRPTEAVSPGFTM